MLYEVITFPYAKLLRATGASARDSLLCEDLRENLVPARDLGIFTVLVTRENGQEREEPPADRSRFPHAVLADVCDLPTVLPRFFREEHGEVPRACAGNRGPVGGDGTLLAGR